MCRHIIGFFVGLSRRRSRRRDNDNQLDGIDNQNDLNKNVGEYGNSPIEAFITNSTTENIVISGSNSELRNRGLCAVAWKCYEQRRGSVILHCGNSQLSQMLRDVFNGAENVHLIDSSNPTYDPFVGLNRNEIAQFVLSSAGEHYKVERNGSSYIYGLSDYLQQIGRVTCIDTFTNCLRERSYEDVMEQAERGLISDFVARRINSELAQGQMQFGNIENYFNVFRQQGSNILADESTFRTAISIKQAIRQNHIISIDIGNSSNELLLNAVLQEIRDTISCGTRFTVMLDSVPVDASESLGQMMRNFSGTCSYVYSSQDVYADTQSTANVFETMLGRAGTVIVLQHYAGATCDAFSRFFGMYHKIEVNHTFTSGDTYSTYTQILPGSSSADIYGTQQIDRPRVESGEIASQHQDHAFIRKNGYSDIISVRCTAGNARDQYPMPRRTALRNASSNTTTRRRRRNNSSRFNLLIFILLLIFIPPAALIYSLVVCGRTGKIISAIILALMIIMIIAQIVMIYTNVLT